MLQDAPKYEKTAYKGSPSTLCKGCGHDSITACIITAYHEMGIRPHGVMKVSGIGCSSKTPTYFLENSHGFNSIHGRVPAVATGAGLARSDLSLLGVSGDGDTMSIGLGQFCHLIRRNVDMLYIVANNGTYGLTKGQFSATTDKGSVTKAGEINPFPVMDICELAVTLDATFVARSFSGDRKQLVDLIKAAVSHKGIAIIDIISPCVTFNNHEGSTKSYPYVKEHDTPLHELGYIPSFTKIEVELKEGETQNIRLHDGSWVRITKINKSFDPKDKAQALRMITSFQKRGEIPTGLFYIKPSENDLAEVLGMSDTPLSQYKEEDLDPGPGPLKELNASWK